MLVARAGLSPVMVGRSRELEHLCELAALEGEPRVAVIRGEAGVGKTRLIQELVAGVGPGVRVLAAQAEQGAMGRPYQLLLEAVAADVREWTRVPGELRRREDALGVLLAPVAPQLQATDRAYAADELAAAGVELVCHLLGPRAGVVIFEDLQWADAESLSLLGRLAVTPGLSALLLGSYRPEDQRHLVTDLIAGLERQRIVTHVVLDRLTVEEVRTLVEAVRNEEVSYAAAAALHARTGGNPFFLEELLLAAADAPVDALGELPLPATLTEAVLRHLDGLELEQRQVVDAAAVLGQRIPFDWLASVTGLGEDVLVDTLRRLVSRGLLCETDEDVFSFRHALTREAVAGRLLARERRRLHEKSLAALQESGSTDWSALAHHAAGAARWDEMVDAARCGAAQYLRTGATYQALRLAELALREADCDTELLELAARAAWSVGLPAAALERAEQWRRLAEESSDPADLSRALRVLARLRWEAGDLAGHLREVDLARRVAESLPTGEERAWVANLLAESAMLNMRSPEAVGWADEALALAGPHPAPALHAAVLVNKGSALIGMPGRGGEGERLLLAGERSAVAAEDYQSALRAVSNLGYHVFPLWPPAQSEALLARMGEYIERSGRQDWAGTWHQLRGTFFLHVLGDLARALAEDEAPVHAGKRAWAAIQSAELALEAGDDARCRTLIQAVVIGPNIENFEKRGALLSLRARRAAGLRRLDEAEAVLGELAAMLPTVPAGPRHWLSDAWCHAVASAVSAGVPPAAARRLMAQVEFSPEDFGGVVDPGWPDQVDGALAEAEGRWEDAVAAYGRAVADRGWRRSPAAVAAAHTGTARCLLALDRRDEARSAARAAAALLEHWPGWRRDEPEVLLRRLAPVTSGATGPGELTGREREVAAMLATGATNGEVAAGLYISTKTASVHVSNILRKLGMSSRAEVAAWAVRQGLAG